jgi:hypothetical protein
MNPTITAALERLEHEQCFHIVAENADGNFPVTGPLAALEDRL